MLEMECKSEEEVKKSEWCVSGEVEIAPQNWVEIGRLKFFISLSDFW
jgi:hypothetical protein